MNKRRRLGRGKLPLEVLQRYTVTDRIDWPTWKAQETARLEKDRAALFWGEEDTWESEGY